MKKAYIIVVLLVCAAMITSCTAGTDRSAETSTKPVSTASESGQGLGAALSANPEKGDTDITDEPQLDAEGLGAALSNGSGASVSFTTCTDLPPESMADVEFVMKQTQIFEYEYRPKNNSVTKEQYEDVIEYLKSKYGEPTIVDEMAGNPILTWASKEAAYMTEGAFLMRVYLQAFEEENFYTMGFYIKKG